MIVADRMTPNPVTVTTETTLKDAIELIRSKSFRHLPVLDRDGELVGVVTEKSLVYASPTPITTLSIFEVDYVLSKMRSMSIGDMPMPSSATLRTTYSPCWTVS